MPDSTDGPKYTAPKQDHPSPSNVRLASPVVAAMRGELPRHQAESVARAIRRIGVEDGEPLAPGGPNEVLPDDGRKYMVMIPDDRDAPVVVFRLLEKVEGGGYLVTGLADRKTYDAWARARQPSFFETPSGRAIQAEAWGALAAAIGIAVDRNAGRGTRSS
jgi:hypothetical protein